MFVCTFAQPPYTSNTKKELQEKIGEKRSPARRNKSHTSSPTTTR
jgi:hypothetical protein